MRRRVTLALLAVAVLAPAAYAETTPTRPVYDSKGRLVQAPFAPVAERARLTKERATEIFLRNEKVADWLARYPTRDRVTEATYDTEARRLEGRRLVGGRRPDRRRAGRRRERRGHRGVDGAAGRMEDGPRLQRRVRRASRSTASRSGSGSASSSCSASAISGGRSACATSTSSSSFRSRSRSGSSTAATSSRASRSSIRRCSTCSAAWSGRRGEAGPDRRARSGRSGCSRPWRSS